MSVFLRIHRVGDLGWIISKHGEIYAAEFDFDASFEINIADKVVKYFSAEQGFNAVWIAEVDGERAGSVAVRSISTQQSFINFVLLLDQYRGRGLALQLMQRVLQYSKDEGYSSVRLETYSCLVAARKLYAAMGFEIVEPPAEIVAFGRPLTQEFWQMKL